MSKATKKVDKRSNSEKKKNNMSANEKRLQTEKYARSKGPVTYM